MCICDSSYPRKLAFSYLDELSKEFQRSYGDKIDSAQRPYAFMGFGECWWRPTSQPPWDDPLTAHIMQLGLQLCGFCDL